MKNDFNSIDITSKILQDLINNEKVSKSRMKEMLNILLCNKLDHSDSFLSSFLSILQVKRIPSNEIIAIVDEILKINEYNPFEIIYHDIPNITCVAGSGKKHFKTLNITTLAAIIASALGAKIIKPISKGVTSKLGSEDLLDKLEITFASTAETAHSMLKKLNICFFSIENLIPKFDSIYGGRQLTISPLSYVLPGLMSPIKYNNLYYGLSDYDLKKAEYLFRYYGVSGNISIVSTFFDKGYIDELSFEQSSTIFFSNNEKENYICPKEIIDDFTLFEDIKPTDNQSSVNDTIKKIEDGQLDEYMKVICLNAAGILLTSGIFESFIAAYDETTRFIVEGGLKNRIKELKRKKLN